MQCLKSYLTLFRRLNHYSFHMPPHVPCLVHQVWTGTWTYKENFNEKCKILEITVGSHLNFSSQKNDMKTTQLCTQIVILHLFKRFQLSKDPLDSMCSVYFPVHIQHANYKARQTRFIVSHQCPLPLRPAASTVIITFQPMTHPLLMAIAS